MGNDKPLRKVRAPRKLAEKTARQTLPVAEPKKTVSSKNLTPVKNMIADELYPFHDLNAADAGILIVTEPSFE